MCDSLHDLEQRRSDQDLYGVQSATVFLKRVNLGESVRLSGDALVVGGGSTAMDAPLQLGQFRDRR